MSLAGLLLGLINIAIWVAIACLIVYVIIFGAAKFEMAIPDKIQRLLWIIVGLIALGMLVGLLIGAGPPMLLHSFR